MGLRGHGAVLLPAARASVSTWGAGALVQRALANPLGYRMGDEACVTARVGRPVAGPLSASLQAKAYHVGRNRFLGRSSRSTGSTVDQPRARTALSGCPAGWPSTAACSVPVFQHVNEGQLGHGRGGPGGAQPAILSVWSRRPLASA